MPFNGFWCSAVVAVCLSAGCVSPYTTRLPSFATQPPALENQSYELHDPFPSASAGPDTQVRPRGYEVPRSEARQAIEGTQVFGGGGQYGPMAPPSSYPQVVPQ